MITAQQIINEKVMALSWKQPYADMMICGKIETRLWPTNYRGLVLICAGLKWYSMAEVDEITGDSFLFKMVNFSKRNKDYQCSFPLGYAIGIGRLVNCYPMREDDEKYTLVKYKAPWMETMARGKHRQFKMVERQRWCHVYEDVVPIKPFEWKGSQGWKTLTDEQKLLIEPII